MKINEICEDFTVLTPTMALLSEIVDRGSRKDSDTDLEQDSDTYYREGIPAYTQILDKGDIKTCMVFLCPLCNGNGKNILKKMGRLNASHITQQSRDLFGGGCGVNRRDYKCINGLMVDRNTGEWFWSHAESPSKKETSSESTITTDVFRSQYPKEYGYYLVLKNKFKEGGFIADNDKKRLIKLIDKIHNNEEFDIRYVENWLKRLVKHDEMRPDVDGKYKNPNKGKGEGKNVDKRVNPNTFRKTQINK